MPGFLRRGRAATGEGVVEFVSFGDIVARLQVLDNDVLGWAAAYRGAGLALVAVRQGDKTPAYGNWTALRPWEELEKYFRFGANIGFLCGEPSNWVVDVDLDSPEAIAAADFFLPPTPAVFGRAGKPRSHRLYRAAGARSAEFADRTANKEVMLAELRSTGRQTVLPPSTHPSGEQITWDTLGEPATVDAEALRKAVAKAAAAALLARRWPRGARQYAALALSGWLLRHWLEEDSYRFVQAVCIAAGDEETPKRLGALENTADNLASDAPTTGRPTLEGLVGREVVALAAEWLGLSRRGEALVSDRPAGLGAAVPYRAWLEGVDPPGWLLQYFIAPGLLTTLAGDAGRGKSTLTSHFLATLLRGEPFLGLATTTPRGRVLVVSEEPRAVWLGRPGLDDRVWFLSTDDLGDWAAFCTELERGEHDFGLVILDSFDAIFEGTSQAEATDINRVLRPLSRAVRNRGLAALVLDFLRKRRDTAEATAKDTAGSYAKVRIVDVLAVLYEADDDEASPRRTLAIKKSRFTVPPEWRAGVVIELRDGQYTRLGTKRELKADEWAAKQQAVLSLLFARGRAGDPWVMPQEIDLAAGLTGENRARQRAKLLAAINTPTEVVVDNGRGTRAVRYALKQFVINTGSQGG